MQISISKVLNAILKFIIPIFIIPFFTTCTGSSEKKDDLVECVPLIEDEEITEKRLYGILIDTFIIDHGEIEPNRNLSHLLNAFGVSSRDIHILAETSKEIFDVRRFKAGNNYSVFFSADSLQELKYFVYEINPVDYVVYDLSDSIRVYTGKKDVTVKETTGVGKIESSLWNSMVARDLPPILSLELSDIYAWTIDFFGLEKGDMYKVVFDEEYVDTVRIGVSNIKYAEFTHKGQKIYAIPFEQDSVVSFFDDEGNSLKKAFLKAPLRFSRISSHFSNSRMHPVLRIRRPHHGVDYAAPVGTPVMSIGDGVVVKRGYSGGAGHMVKIKHNSTYTSAYLHLSKYGEGVTPGARVKQGQIIGYVGSSGLSTGPHLDFRIYKNNNPIDPLKVESPPVEPVKAENIKEFEIVRDSIINILEKIKL